MGYTTAMFVVMNKSKWAALDPELQNIFEATSRKWIDVHGKRWDQNDQEGRDYSLSLENQIIPLSDEQNQQWKANVRPIIDAYIAETTAKNLDGAAYVDMLTQAIEKNTNPSQKIENESGI